MKYPFYMESVFTRKEILVVGEIDLGGTMYCQTIEITGGIRKITFDRMVKVFIENSLNNGKYELRSINDFFGKEEILRRLFLRTHFGWGM